METERKRVGAFVFSVKRADLTCAAEINNPTSLRESSE
jgi:hypothetical protein